MDVKSFIHMLVDYPKLSEGKFFLLLNNSSNGWI